MECLQEQIDQGQERSREEGQKCDLISTGLKALEHLAALEKGHAYAAFHSEEKWSMMVLAHTQPETVLN